ncbi:hypothetical protein CMV_015016 [Castanea mollissima]|uniref:Uncharacterized protein n=1 Tax=Castanea mollissima TaxID=60419 RepID=A0A8J4R2H3_9ROSI|nr:hypothetical protein CMV_015016 [Castanea mollissima]
MGGNGGGKGGGSGGGGGGKGCCGTGGGAAKSGGGGSLGGGSGGKMVAPGSGGGSHISRDSFQSISYAKHMRPFFSLTEKAYVHDAYKSFAFFPYLPKDMCISSLHHKDVDGPPSIVCSIVCYIQNEIRQSWRGIMVKG